MSEQTDAHHGQGGSYVIDPKTQARTLVDRTKSIDEVACVNAGEIEQTTASEITPLTNQTEVE